MSNTPVSPPLIFQTLDHPSGPKAGEFLQLRMDQFDQILVSKWPSNLEGRITQFQPKTRGFMTELKTRYSINKLLTDEKVKALLSLVFWLESQSRTTDVPTIGVPRLERFLEIQIYTRSTEKAILQAGKGQKATYTILADFLRDIATLQALGFTAPKLDQIITAIDHSLDKNPDLAFDEAIIGKYREAVRLGLLAFYYQDPEYLRGITLNKNAPAIAPVGTVTKGANPIPAAPFEKQDYDASARDFTLIPYPAEIIDAMSSECRRVVRSLTRTTPPPIPGVKKRTVL